MTFSIRDFLHVLTPSGESPTKYICPVCGGDDLDIDKDGKYGCFSGGCDSKKIASAVMTLGGFPPKNPNKKSEVARTKTEYLYPARDDSQLAKTVKTKWFDQDGNPKKTFAQAVFSDGAWCWKPSTLPELKKQIPIYRWARVQEAIAQGQQIFIVEGEQVADALWSIGIPATTTIGGSNGYKSNGDYGKDLIGAQLVLCPDRDKPGLKYMANFAKDFNSQIDGYCLAGEIEGWSNPSDGRDLADDIQERGFDKEQILASIKTAEEFNSITFEATETRKPAKDSSRNHYESTPADGLVWVTSEKADDGGFIEKRLKIGHHLAAIAYLDTPDEDGAAILLEFGIVRGGARRWTMPRADLAGDGGEICRGLLARGYGFERKQKTHLLSYLQGLGADIGQTYTITDSTGWIMKSFVLPHKTHGDPDLRFRDVDVSPESLTEIAGTLDGWKESVAKRCGGNSRLILALAVAFAAPLLPLLGIESGGFHLVGETSKGKTTILSVAASVLGWKDIPNWRTTTNGLESTAAAFNHLCLPLDEIGQAEAKDMGALAYMLANGQGKSRMKKDLTNRKGKIWQLLFLSSGEVGLGDYMAQAGQTQKGGQEVRSPDIPAIPAGSAYGCFESIHGADSAVQFVGGLEAAVKAQHGTAMDAYLSRLVVDAQEPMLIGKWSQQLHLLAAKLSSGYTDTAIGRVAKRFALVQVALGLAHSYGLLPFPAEQIDWAIKTCFDAWVKERGGDGSIEIKRAIERIEHLLISNELGDRVFTLPDNSGMKSRNLLAYRRLDIDGGTQDLLVPPSVFNKEFCEGVNKAELIRELQAQGILKESDGDGRPDRQIQINGEKKRLYVFLLDRIGKREKPVGDLGDLGLNPEQPKSTATDTLTQTHEIDLGDLGEARAWSPKSPKSKFTSWVTHPTAENLAGQGMEGTPPRSPSQKTEIPINDQVFDFDSIPEATPDEF